MLTPKATPVTIRYFTTSAIETEVTHLCHLATGTDVVSEESTSCDIDTEETMEDVW